MTLFTYKPRSNVNAALYASHIIRPHSVTRLIRRHYYDLGHMEDFQFFCCFRFFFVCATTIEFFYMPFKWLTCKWNQKWFNNKMKKKRSLEFCKMSSRHFSRSVSMNVLSSATNQMRESPRHVEITYKAEIYAQSFSWLNKEQSNSKSAVVLPPHNSLLSLIMWPTAPGKKLF